MWLHHQAQNEFLICEYVDYTIEPHLWVRSFMHERESAGPFL